MKYGFVMDNRKCIGCHACTTACKSEHDVPVGVNRTWVKQIEKGQFPETSRVFQVSRCNQCTDAPCVEICPVESLFIRDDGIVDFNNDRCIGCKSCMQACPYDALYIDPTTKTAAKCNYCANRIDIGLEPACVNVCPTHAIISGDMDNPDSEISQILAKEKVTVQKAEKGTSPKVFYIDGDLVSLNPTATEKSSDTMWGSQVSGVGHYAKFAEELTGKSDIGAMEKELSGKEATFGGDESTYKDGPRRVYDAPDKGILWGWEVSAYILTKAVSSGVFLMAFIAMIFGFAELDSTLNTVGIITSIVFLGLTGAFLVKDLDQPKRFAYVLLRPQWNSWLVRGGYAITIYGGLLSLLLVAGMMQWREIVNVVNWITAPFAILVSIYTAFLFAQAKGRDFWQSPMLAVHMFLHSLISGIAAFFILNVFFDSNLAWEAYLTTALYILIGFNLAIMLVELTITHPTEDTKRTIHMIVKGRYKSKFWIGSILLGNILPLILIWTGGVELMVVSGLLLIRGVYITESIWVEAPQRIPLS